jgi:hypothetical protein
MQFSTLILALAASTSLSLAQPIAMEHVESIIEVPSSSTPSVLEAREPLFGFGKSKPPKIDYQVRVLHRIPLNISLLHGIIVLEP